MNGPDPRGSLRRRDAPVWQQAAEGIGLVIALSAVVTVVVRPDNASNRASGYDA